MPGGLTVVDGAVDDATLARLAARAPAAAAQAHVEVSLPPDDPDVVAVAAALGWPAPRAATLRAAGLGASAAAVAGGDAAVVFLDGGPGGGVRVPGGPSATAERGRAVRVAAGTPLARAPVTGAAVVTLELAFTAPGAGLTVIADARTPEPTVASLRRAATARGLPFAVVDPDTLDPRAPPLPPGALLYAAATSVTASEAEHQLWQPGVGSLWGPEGPYRVTVGGLRSFARAGLSVPRSVVLKPADADRLDALVTWVGGLPAVVKVPGGELGVGTLRVDSLPALRSLLDLLWARHERPRLLAYVEDALHWRVIVVDGAVVTAYRNPVRSGDFRSTPGEAADDYGLVPPDEAARLAVGATAASGVRFGGVDVLEHASGRFYVLEVNFPCFFAQAERFGRADVAGAMVEAMVRGAAKG